MTDPRVEAARALENRALAALGELIARKRELKVDDAPDLATLPPALMALHYRAAAARKSALVKIEASIRDARKTATRAVARRRAVEEMVEKAARARAREKERRAARTLDWPG